MGLGTILLVHCDLGDAPLASCLDGISCEAPKVCFVELRPTAVVNEGPFRQGVDVEFGFVAKHLGDWPMLLICEELGISCSGYCAWLERPRSRRSQDDEVLGGQVHHSFVGSDRTYGDRRERHDVLALGQRCGLHRIERLIRHQRVGSAASADPAVLC